MFLTVRVNGTGARDADEDHIQLVVDMLTHTASGLEANQVGVEVAALPQHPDHASSLAGSRCHPGQIHQPSSRDVLCVVDTLFPAQACSPDGILDLLVACTTPPIIYHS